MRLRWLLFIGIMTATALLAACTPGAGSPPVAGDAGDEGEVRLFIGTVAYRERIAMPAGAVIRVQLLEFPDDGARPNVIAEQSIRPSGEVPVHFALQYKRGEIRARGSYGLIAAIEVGGEVRWRTDEPTLVLTNGNPDDLVELILTRAP